MSVHPTNQTGFHEIRAPNKELRFAQIIGNQFLLRGNRSQIYEGERMQQLEVSKQAVAKTLQKYCSNRLSLPSEKQAKIYMNSMKKQYLTVWFLMN